MNDDFYRVIGGEQHEGAIVVSQLDEPVDYSPMLSGRVANIVPVDSIDKVTAAVNATPRRSASTPNRSSAGCETRCRCSVPND